MFFDERSHKVNSFEVESFGQKVRYFIDQLAASVVGVREGGSMARKGVLKERLFYLQIVSLGDHKGTGRHFAEVVPLQATA